MKHRPVTFILDSCSLERLARMATSPEVARLHRAVNEGHLVHLVGNALLPELWAMLQDPTNLASYQEQANQILLLKTGPRFTPCWIVPWFTSMVWRMNFEHFHGGALSLKKGTREGFQVAVDTYQAAKDPTLRNALLLRADQFKVEDKKEEDAHKETANFVLSQTQQQQQETLQPPPDHELAPLAVDVMKDFMGVDKNPGRFLTTWAFACFAVYITRREATHNTASPLHRSDLQYFVDSVYADILVTNDGEHGKPTGLLNRVREMKRLGLAKRPHFVATLEEFVAWFSSEWTPGTVLTATPDGRLPA